MQNSTDDEASDTQPTKRIVPRYHFDYPALSTNDVPIFSTKAFWECFHSSEARAFAKLICRIRNPRYKSGSAQEHQALLEQALPELLYPRVDATQELPKDVTVALAGLDRVIVTLDQPPDEYTYLRFPDLGTSPYFAADARPPTSQKQATDDELRNAPHLYRQLPNPIKKGKTPVKASKNGPIIRPTRSRATTSAKKSSGKVAPPAQKKVKLDPVAGTSKATPAKGPAPILRPLAPVNYSRDLDPSDEESDEQTIPEPSAAPVVLPRSRIGLGRRNGSTKRPHPFNNQSLGLTLSYLQEHRSYNPRTALGP
ncbi:hypothetical protein B0H14DRAFT_2652309, partial [Mycena olivaceomarginata]